MDHVLQLGEAFNVAVRPFVQRRIIYAGEVSPGVYSIVLEWSCLYNSAGINLYFRGDQAPFKVFGGRFAVLDASPGELRFRFEK